MAVIGVCSSASARAGLTTVDFEALGHLDDPTSYLVGFGITVTADAGTALFVLDDTIVYGGGALDAPSGSKYVSQIDASGSGAAFPPNTFLLDFAQPLDSFGFSESAILVPSITASWTATAYSGPGGTGSILDTASFSGSFLHPVLTYTLVGPGISSVKFDQTAPSNAGYYAGNFDDFVLESSTAPEPGSIVLCLTGLAVVGLRRWRPGSICCMGRASSRGAS